MGDDAAWPRSYVVRAVLNWLFFLGVVLFLSLFRDSKDVTDVVRWTAVMLVAVSVAYQFLAAYRVIARQDEFVRGLTAKRMLVAAGVTVTFAVVWGLAEQFLGVPRAPMWLLYPLFWGVFGIVTPFIKSSLP